MARTPAKKKSSASTVKKAVVKKTTKPRAKKTVAKKRPARAKKSTKKPAEDSSLDHSAETPEQEQPPEEPKATESPAPSHKPERKRLLNLSQARADVYLPQRIPLAAALKRTSHLGIFAHPDDQEIGAPYAISTCYQQQQKWFTGVILTDGAGSNQSQKYPRANKEEMSRIRKNEQRDAATLGDYSAQIQLAHRSDHLRGEKKTAVVEELIELLSLTQPEYIFTHSPFDHHPTHRNTFHCLQLALREMKDFSPRGIYGCEIWGSLEWLPEPYRVTFPASEHPELIEELVNCFPSQVQDNRPYDLALLGRHLANSTFANPHKPSAQSAMSYALDLTKFMLSQKKLSSLLLDIQKAYKEKILAEWNEDGAS